MSASTTTTESASGESHSKHKKKREKGKKGAITNTFPITQLNLSDENCVPLIPQQKKKKEEPMVDDKMRESKSKLNETIISHFSEMTIKTFLTLGSRQLRELGLRADQRKEVLDWRAKIFNHSPHSTISKSTCTLLFSLLLNLFFF